MTAGGDHVLAQATRLVKHCQHTQRLLQQIVDCCDGALYDPISDRYAVRLPGGLIRTIRTVLEEAERDPDLPRLQPES